MLQTLTKYLIIFVTFINLNACKFNNQVTRLEFLDEIILQSGFKDQAYDELVNYGVIESDELDSLNEILDYPFVYKSLSRLIDNNAKEDILIEKAIIKTFKEGQVDFEYVKNLIKEVVYYINHQSFDTKFSAKTYIHKELDDYKLDGNFLYTENKLSKEDLIKIDDTSYKVKQVYEDYYEVEEAAVEDLYQNLQFSYSDDIDFQNIEILEDQIIEFEDVDYHDDLKRHNDEHFANVKEINGYRISYSFTPKSLYFYVSRKVGGVNAYFNTRISHLRPSVDWDYEKGVIKHAYFKLNYETSESFGFSKAKYKRLYADLEQLNNQDLISALTNLIKENNDEIENSFTICKFKLAIPDMPMVNIICDVKLNFYISGKVGISIVTNNEQGLEINNNQMRIINNNQHDVDGFIGANASSTISLGTALALNDYKLMDIKTLAGLKAKIKTTAHLHDKVSVVDLNYDVANEVLEEKGIPVCGDLMFHWILDVVFNSNDTLAYRLGLSKAIHILNEDNQVFHNLTHIENGLFVDHCTRKARMNKVNNVELDANEIILDRYSIILREKEAKINILALPKKYQLQDLLFISEDKNIVTVDAQGLITAHNPGATKIKVVTKDNKYEVYVSILVSNYQNTSCICLTR